MTKLKETIDDIAHGLYKADIIDQKTLRDLVEDELPPLNEYSGKDIKKIRRRQKLSQAVFAKYLNISPATVRSLEQGQRHAHGAILKLLNIVDKRGIDGVV